MEIIQLYPKLDKVVIILAQFRTSTLLLQTI